MKILIALLAAAIVSSGEPAPDATPAATPSVQVTAVPVYLNPGGFQDAALRWIEVATVVAGALAVLATYIIKEINIVKQAVRDQKQDITARMDRQAVTLNSQQDQISRVSLATPPALQDAQEGASGPKPAIPPVKL